MMTHSLPDPGCNPGGSVRGKPDAMKRTLHLGYGCNRSRHHHGSEAWVVVHLTDPLGKGENTFKLLTLF